MLLVGDRLSQPESEMEELLLKPQISVGVFTYCPMFWTRIDKKSSLFFKANFKRQRLNERLAVLLFPVRFESFVDVSARKGGKHQSLNRTRK